jgi:hypothetical protein
VQDSQLEAMSRMEAQAGQASRTARRAYDLAVQAIQDASSMPLPTAGAKQPDTEKRGTAWSGTERRTASVVPFTGPERRKTAQIR